MSGFHTDELLKSLSRYPVAKGDVKGHEFHGNQYESVAGVSSDKRTLKAINITNALKKAGFVKSEEGGGRITSDWSHGFSVYRSPLRQFYVRVNSDAVRKKGVTTDLRVWRNGEPISHSDFKGVMKTYRDALIKMGFEVGEIPHNGNFLEVKGFRSK